MSKWINIRDKMPPQDGRYLVIETYAFDSVWIGVCSLRHGKWDSHAVTYWMPLPNPPQ